MVFIEKFAFLSNFYPCKITMYGKEYNSVEAAFQAAKTRDPAERLKIQEASSPALAKRLGRKVKMRPDWNTFRLAAMEELLRRKFALPVLAIKLKETGEERLVENNSWHDNFWGSCTCDRCGNGGSNHLGKLLMKIRGEIK